MSKQRLMPKGHWDWSMPVPFSQGWLTDDCLFVGGQISADEKGRTVSPGDVATQTRNVFEFIRMVLDEAGANFSDIVKLNTYYKFDGESSQLADYRRQIKEVENELLPHPGPVEASVRVRGFAFEDLLIEIEAIAAVGRQKKLIDPPDHWSWGDGADLAHGWQVSDLVIVGGQVSKDSAGQTLGAGDIATQTRNVFESMGAVLAEAGSSFDDLVKLNTYYRYGGAEATGFWEDMTKVRMEFLADPGPSGTAVRVDGLDDDDLLIQIEGIAYTGGDRQRLMPADHWDWSMPVPFSQGWRVGNLVFVGGQISADSKGRTVGAGDIATQTRNVFEGITKVLEAGGANWENVLRLNTYYHYEGEGEQVTSFWEDMTRVRMEYLPTPGPSGTAVRVNGFAYEDLLIEVEAVAVIEE